MTTVLASNAGDNEHLDEEMEQIVTDIKGHCNSLVPSLSARQIFIACSMKNRRGKSGSKRHNDACRNVTEASHVVYFIFVNVIVRLRHECQRECKQRAKDTRTKALN